MYENSYELLICPFAPGKGQTVLHACSVLVGVMRFVDNVRKRMICSGVVQEK